MAGSGRARDTPAHGCLERVRALDIPAHSADALGRARGVTLQARHGSSHPEASAHNYEEVLTLSKIIKTENGAIIDPLHRTLPILSKYEKTRIIGQRAKQLEVGAKPFIDVPDGINRGITIAEMELKAKKIPFIIRRPLPNNGFEYWKVEDLEII